MLEIRKYCFLIRNTVFPLYNWWYSVLSNMYVNMSSTLEHMVIPFKLMVRSLVWRVHKKLFVMSSWQLQPFHIKEVYFLAFTNVLTSHTFIYWRLQTFLRHIPSFIDGYDLFTLKPFIYWRLGTFYVKNLSFLMVTYVSN